MNKVFQSKKTTLFIIAILTAVNAIGQITAYKTENVNLATGKVINTSSWHDKYFFNDKELEWAVRYATILAPKYQQIDTALTYDFIKEQMHRFTFRAYSKYLSEHMIAGLSYAYIYSRTTYSDLFHNKLFSNKQFRDLAFNTASDMLCDFISFYPKDYKTRIVNEIQDITDFIRTIPSHNYNVETICEGGGCYYALRDGDKYEDELCYGMEGFVLRRMLMNKVPYDEILDKAERLLANIKEVDNSKNPDVMLRYDINGSLSYCIGAEAPYLSTLLPINELDYDYNGNCLSKSKYGEYRFFDRIRRNVITHYGFYSYYDLRIENLKDVICKKYYCDKDAEEYSVPLFKIKVDDTKAENKENLWYLTIDGRCVVNEKKYYTEY